MDISTRIVFMLEIMMFLVPVAAFVVFVGWILRRQIIKKRMWLGWIILAVIFVLFTSTSILLAKYNVANGANAFPYQESAGSFGFPGPMEVTIQGSGIVRASLQICQKPNSDEVYGFGTLQIEYDDGVQYIPLEFDKTGELVAPSEAIQYEQAIRDALSEDENNIILTGNSKSYIEMNNILKTKSPMKSSILLPDFIVYYFIRFQIITILLIGYYLFAWKQNRNKEKCNTDFVKIQDL